MVGIGAAVGSAAGAGTEMVNESVTIPPLPSLAVTATAYVPATDGTPRMLPPLDSSPLPCGWITTAYESVSPFGSVNAVPPLVAS